MVTPLAGMPSFSLNDVAALRIEAISFFLLVFLAATKAVQRLWNGLCSDFPRLPRLSFRRALGVVALWGVLFVLVLTMISGARELMTPGAWEKVGLTYRLAEKPGGSLATAPAEGERRAKLCRLREVLWAYAVSHGGKLPSGPTDPDIAAEFWQLPDPSGVTYGYVPGRMVHLGADVVAFEPSLFGDDPWVLFVNGDVRRITANELSAALAGRAAR